MCFVASTRTIVLGHLGSYATVAGIQHVHVCILAGS